jgi:hypothetical protein
MSADFREEAEKHWQFIEKLLEPQVPIEKVKYLYVEAMVHGYKHAIQTIPAKQSEDT